MRHGGPEPRERGGSMSKKALRITVRGGRLMAIYDDRLAGLIERLGGARSGDGAGGRTDSRAVGSSSQDDGSRPGPRRSHTARPGDARAAAGHSCRTGSLRDDELPGANLGALVDARGDRQLCTCGSIVRSYREDHDTENIRHAGADEGRLTCCYCKTFMRGVEHVSRSGPPLIITRASHVEPGPEGGWTADMAPSGGGVLGPYLTRADALEAEQAWLRQERGL